MLTASTVFLLPPTRVYSVMAGKHSGNITGKNSGNIFGKATSPFTLPYPATTLQSSEKISSRDARLVPANISGNISGKNSGNKIGKNGNAARPLTVAHPYATIIATPEKIGARAPQRTPATSPATPSAKNRQYLRQQFRQYLRQRFTLCPHQRYDTYGRQS